MQRNPTRPPRRKPKNRAGSQVAKVRRFRSIGNTAGAYPANGYFGLPRTRKAPPGDCWGIRAFHPCGVIQLRLLLGLAIALPIQIGAAQELPFIVSIVDWSHDALERQRRAYRFEAGEREVLYCVESWTKSDTSGGVQRLVIEAVRRDQLGHRHGISDVGDRCIDKDGRPLPTFHTHSDGNCQFSPSDLISTVGRGAPFEGVQCGERHFIWTFAWQIVAIANSVKRERRANASVRKP